MDTTLYLLIQPEIYNNDPHTGPHRVLILATRATPEYTVATLLTTNMTRKTW